MIAALSGTLVSKSPQAVVVEVGGVGYQLTVPLTTFYKLPELSRSIRLYVHTYLREDAISLYGFLNTRDRDLFLLLIGVSGVGPKTAIGLLSGLDSDELIRAIRRGDERLLSSVPGFGRKTASRLILELKEKVLSLGEIASDGAGSDLSQEAVSALVHLGYPRSAAKEAVERVGGDRPVEEILREALKALAKG